jgi:hypothetical protein
MGENSENSGSYRHRKLFSEWDSSCLGNKNKNGYMETLSNLKVFAHQKKQLPITRSIRDTHRM